MVARPKILCVGQPPNGAESALGATPDFEVVQATSPLEGLAQLAREEFAAVHIYPDSDIGPAEFAKLVQSERILEAIPDGVTLLDAKNAIVWANQPIRNWCRRSLHAKPAPNPP